ncbi:unnamed protein product [Schistocephalus solidus]|uniref:Secreted protein n=1 Tax=Schistocephalus solidus TaxID=70667 RepID=A0A183STR6_SCHSO|nr:unnamed protein product [Schistocephalus solidus]
MIAVGFLACLLPPGVLAFLLLLLLLLLLLCCCCCPPEVCELTGGSGSGGGGDYGRTGEHIAKITAFAVLTTLAMPTRLAHLARVMCDGVCVMEAQTAWAGIQTADHIALCFQPAHLKQKEV